MTYVAYLPKFDCLALIEQRDNCFLLSYDGTIWRVLMQREFNKFNRDRTVLGVL
jgi:hypothetical protein